MTILKQFTLACTPNGAIGKGEELLFTSSVDLAKFKGFTRKTVMIAGRITAQQMISAGVRIQERPLIVISESGIIESVRKEDLPYVTYAQNLQDAVELAERLAERQNLLGWTIVGGKTVYESMFDLLDKGSLRINRAYLFVTELPDWSMPANPVILNRDVAQIVTLVSARMADESVKIWKCDPVLMSGVPSSSKPAPIRGINGAFIDIVDKGEFDFENIKLDPFTNVFTVKSGGHTETIKAQITGWSYRNDVDSVDIRLFNGHTVSLRPGSKAAVNALLLTLQSF